MARTNTATIEADPEVARCEEALRAAEQARDEACKRADDPGEMIGQARWKRLPLPEAEATKLKSDANYKVKVARWALAKATRPKLARDEAQAALARAEAHRAECQGRLARVVEEKNSDDRATALRAGRREREVVDALLDADLALEIAQATVRDAEAAAVSQRTPLFELRAITLARQVDGLLDALVAIVRDQVALDEQARVAGCPMDAGIFVGALPEGVAHWRARNAGRLVRENAE